MAPTIGERLAACWTEGSLCSDLATKTHLILVVANITTALFFEVYPEFNPRPADLFCALVLGSLWAAYNARLVWLILRRLRQIRERYGVDIHPLPFDVVREAETACADDEIQQQL